MIAAQLARWVHEAGLDVWSHDLTFAEVARGLVLARGPKRALSEAVTSCKRVSERRLSIAAMVRGKGRGR